jgi:hypothetical protein
MKSVQSQKFCEVKYTEILRIHYSFLPPGAYVQFQIDAILHPFRATTLQSLFVSNLCQKLRTIHLVFLVKSIHIHTTHA